MDVDTEKIEKEAANIADILEGVHDNPLKNAHELVELLESREALEKALGVIHY